MQNIKDYQSELNAWCNNHTPEVAFTYSVPLLGEGGTCSLFGELDPVPFDLNSVLTPSQLNLVAACQSIVDWVKHKTDVDWFGIYLKINDNKQHSLTKLAYFGAPSRAQFPLTEEFAQISNNSAVGMSGKARVINNVSAFVADGGEYYTCDPKVQSELCLPIISNINNNSGQHDAEILGIIDAESFTTNCFDQEQLALFQAVCAVLSEKITKSENT